MLDASDETTAIDELASGAKGERGVFETAHLIGKLLWELSSKSAGRLMLTFAAVYVASFLPALLIILWFTVASQTYTRGGLLLLVLICLIPIAAMMGFNRAAYLGLHDVVKKIGLGKQIGAAFVAFIEPSDRMRIPLTDFSSRLKQFSKTARNEAREEYHGVRGFFLRGVNAMVFYSASFVLNQIAKGCVVDGQVDLEKFATGIGDRADDLLIAYFKKILWDLTRVIVGFAVLFVWLLVYLAIQLINLLS